MDNAIPLVDLKAQYERIGPEIDAAIRRVLTHTGFILGKEVDDFERAFAGYCQAAAGVGVASGTAALHLALEACGVGKGDDVITTPFTFFATVEAIMQVGARPVFVDIDPATYNLDPGKLEEAVTPRAKAIIPVHLYGQPAEMDAVLEVARRHHLAVIEDAAQAHGALYKERRVGSIGDVACFSFYPSKNLARTATRAVVTNDLSLAAKIRMSRNHGRSTKYEHEQAGWGYRLDALQAAILGVKLKHLDEWNAARREKAQRYNALLADLDIIRPYEPEHVQAVHHLYTVRVERREEVIAHLKGQGIETGVHYPVPMHLQPALKAHGHKRGDFPVSEQFAGQVLSLPLYAEMTDTQQERVAAALRSFAERN